MLIRIPVLFLLVAGFIGLAYSADEEVLVKKDDDRRDLTMLKREGANVFIHELARMSYTIPKDWKEIRPQRLTRKLEIRPSTVLGVQREERDMVATLYWLPISQGAKLSDWIRENEVSGEYGEEYETLRSVYGRERITTPKSMKYGTFEVYKISIEGGPDRGEKYNGVLYVFEHSNEDGRWLIKARVSFPKTVEKGANEKYAEEVLQGYALLPATATTPKK